MAFASPDDAVVAHIELAKVMESKAGKEIISTLGITTRLLIGSGSLEKEFGLGLDKMEAITLAVPDGPNAVPRTLSAAMAFDLRVLAGLMMPLTEKGRERPSDHVRPRDFVSIFKARDVPKFRIDRAMIIVERLGQEHLPSGRARHILNRPIVSRE